MIGFASVPPNPILVLNFLEYGRVSSIGSVGKVYGFKSYVSTWDLLVISGWCVFHRASAIKLSWNWFAVIYFFLLRSVDYSSIQGFAGLCNSFSENFCKLIWLSPEFDIEIWKCGHHFVLAHISTSSTIILIKSGKKSKPWEAICSNNSMGKVKSFW